jgi:hypothetical protein
VGVANVLFEVAIPDVLNPFGADREDILTGRIVHGELGYAEGNLSCLDPIAIKCSQHDSLRPESRTIGSSHLKVSGEL